MPGGYWPLGWPSPFSEPREATGALSPYVMSRTDTGRQIDLSCVTGRTDTGPATSLAVTHGLSSKLALLPDKRLSVSREGAESY
jgi:hypothetical protein